VAVSLVNRLRGLYWELNPPLRRAARRLKTEASVTLHRLRGLTGRSPGTRVVPASAKGPHVALPQPAVTVIPTDTNGSHDPPDTPYLAHADGLDELPAAHLEALLMAAAAEDLSWVAGGWSAPAPGLYGPSGRVLREPDVPQTAHVLLRRPDGADRRDPVSGRVIGHITSKERCTGLEPVDDFDAVGPYRLRPDGGRPAVLRRPWRPVDEVLAAVPEVDGPRTALFLLPFLAVGGAERLLFDLLEGLRTRYRLLIATTDPHTEALGQTVDRARELTPHVHTLGDWLPRPAITSAVRHLIRRWKVETLCCWNGSVLFYDEAAALRRAFPDLRIVNQLFNHHGGWIDHLSPSLIRAVDTQIAVNAPIARTLTSERGVPGERVETIHHAVATPAPRDQDRRARLRRELGVDDNTVVIGTFVRMHPQKRPLDVVHIARRMADEQVHFLLVGGGPLDAELDAEIRRDPPPNLTRRPMLEDASPLYDALDLCLMTSDFEGLPVFLLDGLARGLPGVAPAVGDIPLLFADDGGRCVDSPGDIDAAVAAIRSLLDVEHRQAAGERGRATVAVRFGLDRYVAEYESVIFTRLGS
jgi:glycosyltransferase involved in cell wall biosynthesis